MQLNNIVATNQKDSENKRKSQSYKLTHFKNSYKLNSHRDLRGVDKFKENKTTRRSL